MSSIDVRKTRVYASIGSIHDFTAGIRKAFSQEDIDIAAIDELAIAAINEIQHIRNIIGTLEVEHDSGATG